MGSSDGYEMIGSGDVRVIEENDIEGFLKTEGMMEVEHNHHMMNSIGNSSKMSRSNDQNERFECIFYIDLVEDCD